jgi:hypothetical protein
LGSGTGGERGGESGEDILPVGCTSEEMADFKKYQFNNLTTFPPLLPIVLGKLEKYVQKASAG